MRFMSSSTVVIPPNPKFSTRTFSTPSDTNAGSVGPMWIFFTPKDNSASSTITAFCSYQAMLKAIGSSLISLAPNISLSFKATTAQE